jgi:lysyl-tRNA synthetase class 2
MSGIPYRYEVTHAAAAVRSGWERLAPGEESDDVVSVAGRVMLLRTQGKVAFGELRDSSGAIQLFAQSGTTADFEGFSRLNLGDWVGAKGEVIRTRRGELSVRVRQWTLLAEARRSFGDKWRGVHDVETRSRQREVDLWANESTRRHLMVRSELVQKMRERLWAQGFVEVETPILHPIPGGAEARPFVTHHNALDAELYLRIAPELYLKRLVIGGFEKVFEIGRLFRNEGLSPRHNPEFTTLELYWAYADYRDMMAFVEELVAGLARDVLGTCALEYQGRLLDLSPPWRRATMAELIEEHTGNAVHVQMGRDELAALLAATGAEADPSWGRGKLMAEYYEKTTEAELWDPVFVTDFPEEVSPLARRHRDGRGLVERFEPVAAGREFGNAFSELVDPDDQRRRFEAQAARHAAGDEEAAPLDEEYLRAMEYGLPPTAGLGLGIDRLAMLFTDSANIREVIAFPTLRPERRGPSAAG